MLHVSRQIVGVAGNKIDITVGLNKENDLTADISGSLDDGLEIDGFIESGTELEGTIEESEDVYVEVGTKNEVNVSITSAGATGKHGLNAYEMWLDLGNEGTLGDFFNSLKGEDGRNYIHPEFHSADMIEENNNRNFLTLAEKNSAIQTFIHDQIVSAEEWIIEHNLGKFPTITIVDTADSVVVGNVEYKSENVLRVRFTSEFSGKAYLN